VRSETAKIGRQYLLKLDYRNGGLTLNRSSLTTSESDAPGTRREQYAEETKQAIVDAARQLFRTQGYFGTKVNEIAAVARVSPATVYAVSGGKNGLLESLIESWATAPIVASTLSNIDELEEPDAILRLLAASCRSMREEFGDIIRVLLATAPHVEVVAQSLAVATATYRRALQSVAKRLATLGALRDGLKKGDALDILWFYFGYSALFTLVDDNGWSYDKAQHWLADEAIRVLLRDPRA
jgi:AcrR family transcriptional regulator